MVVSEAAGECGLVVGVRSVDFLARDSYSPGPKMVNSNRLALLNILALCLLNSESFREFVSTFLTLRKDVSVSTGEA